MIGGGSISLTAPLCVIPEGAGPVKGAGSVAVVVLCFLRRVLGERQRGVGVQDRPEADRVAAAGPGGPRRAGGCCSARRTVCGRRSFLLIGSVGVRLLQGSCSAGGQALGGLSVIPSPRRW